LGKLQIKICQAIINFPLRTFLRSKNRDQGGFIQAILVIGIVIVLILVIASRNKKEESPDNLKESPDALSDIPIAGSRGPDYWTYTNLPALSDKAVQKKYCGMSDSQRRSLNQEKLTEARELSDKLENYIRLWAAGKASPNLPDELLPASMVHEKTKNWRLYRPEEITSDKQWYYRLAGEIPSDFSKLYFLSPDNHVTYLKTVFTAPLGSRLLAEGDFPHARFMDYQILEPFDPEHPTTSGLGAPEVPIVDVDINPDPGHTNPFRIGADRNAALRHYHVTFNLEAGNAAALNPQAMIPPAYRASGNTRTGGPFAYSGPLGDGQIIASTLWLRYYAPDKKVGPFGGVALPKLTLQLETGERFWLQPDFSLAAKRQTTTVPGFSTKPKDPLPLLGPTVGWGKVFGFWLTLADGFAYPLAKPWGLFPKSLAVKLITERDECYFNRGASASPPGNYEASASGMNYNSYLYRAISLGEDKVYVLTGKLPKTPKTRNGEASVTKSEARYWSICHTGNGEDNKFPSLLYGCLMDDEIHLNQNREYTIVYSRKNERPKNATEQCGVTWQDYGLEALQGYTIRWASVVPDDYLPKFAPDQDNIPWSVGEWSSPDYNMSLTGYNNQNGFLKKYQPLNHYMTREEFEALGCPVSPESVPIWQ